MTAISPQLLAAATRDARNQLAAAAAVDINDHTAVVGSQEALAVALRRVLWTLGELDEPDVAAQVAAEDGYRSIGIPIQRTAVAA
ncbi:hypothetical protein ABZ438_07710 [Streptomyces sp. NPDC005786]|uniref:hypothetical protein n=1 Tax=Streptomyces sp. NPDC005786 TaxID=3154891 RepID=UPI0033F0CB1A